MQNLGEDIVLLAIKRNGTIAAYDRLRFALAGSELVRLAEARRIDVDQDGYIDILDTSPTGNALTDTALAALEDATRPLEAEKWVARQPPALVNMYLTHLTGAGSIRAEDSKVLGLFRIRRWIVVDTARVTDAKGRLDAIASTTGPVTREQAAFGGLVHAAGLAVWLYPKRTDLAERDRLRAIARQDETIEIVDDALASATSAVDTATDATANAAIQAAMWSSIRSSVNATHHAAAQHHPTGQTGGAHHSGGGAAGGHHG
jgi:hypothetical protein